MTLRITPLAGRQIEAIREYLKERSPAAAIRVGQRFLQTFDLLVAMPLVGRKGALANTREFVVSRFPYVIVYRVDPDKDEVVILGVYHGAQLRPGQEREK